MDVVTLRILLHFVPLVSPTGLNLSTRNPSYHRSSPGHFGRAWNHACGTGGAHEPPGRGGGGGPPTKSSDRREGLNHLNGLTCLNGSLLKLPNIQKPKNSRSSFYVLLTPPISNLNIQNHHFDSFFTSPQRRLRRLGLDLLGAEAFRHRRPPRVRSCSWLHEGEDSGDHWREHRRFYFFGFNFQKDIDLVVLFGGVGMHVNR